MGLGPILFVCVFLFSFFVLFCFLYSYNLLFKPGNASNHQQRGTLRRSEGLLVTYWNFIGSLSGVYREFIGSLSGVYREFVARLLEGLSGVDRTLLG